MLQIVYYWHFKIHMAWTDAKSKSKTPHFNLCINAHAEITRYFAEESEHKQNVSGENINRVTLNQSYPAIGTCREQNLQFDTLTISRVLQTELLR